MKNIIFNFIGSIISSLHRTNDIKRINPKHYLIYKDIYAIENNQNFRDTIDITRRRRESIKDDIAKHIPKLLELGLLKEDDLYIDLTGGDNTMGLSDDKLIELRLSQYLAYRRIKYDFSPYIIKSFCDDVSGKWVYYKFTYDTDDYECGWTSDINSSWIRKYGIFEKGCMYIDRGSGNRVHQEWLDKLRKLVNAYKSYKEMIENKQTNKINLKFKELENKGK